MTSMTLARVATADSVINSAAAQSGGRRKNLRSSPGLHRSDWNTMTILREVPTGSKELVKQQLCPVPPKQRKLISLLTKSRTTPS